MVTQSTQQTTSVDNFCTAAFSKNNGEPLVKLAELAAKKPEYYNDDEDIEFELEVYQLLFNLAEKGSAHNVRHADTHTHTQWPIKVTLVAVWRWMW
jgi:hypothetical protein